MLFDDSVLKNLPALAVVVAALIAAAMAGLNLLLTKELKSAELRDAWAVALRDDIATFCASARLFARSQEIELIHRVLERECKARGELFDAVSLGLSSPYTTEQIAEVRYQTALTRFRIQLQLDPESSDHGRLLNSMRDAIDVQNSLVGKQIATARDVVNETDTLMRKIGDVADYAQLFLRKEKARATGGTVQLRLALLLLGACFIWGVFTVYKLLNVVTVAKAEIRVTSAACNTVDLYSINTKCPPNPITTLDTNILVPAVRVVPAGK